MEQTNKQSNRKERRAAKNASFSLLKELVDKSDPKYKEALTIIRPSLYGVAFATGSRTSTREDFIKLVVEKKTVNEDEVFKAFKIGRKEAAGLIRKHLRSVVPAERRWVRFDAQKGLYIHAGNGDKAPKDWDGYVPVAEVEDLK